MGGVQGPQDASFPFMNFSTLSLVNIVKADPAVAHVNAYTGSGNGGFMFIALKPPGTSCKEGSRGCDVRQTSAMDVINRLRPKMNRLPVASAFLQPAQDLRIGGRGSSAHVSIHHPVRQHYRPGALGPNPARRTCGSFPTWRT